MMSVYGTNSKERLTVPVLLSIPSLAAVWVFTSVLNGLSVQLPFLVEAPSLMGTYALLLWLFDTRGWRIPLLRTVARVKVPELAGEWRGTLSSTYRNTIRGDVQLHITQTWSRILVELETSDSRSASTVAALLVGDGVPPELTYQYLNEPRPGTASSMEAHRGTATLRLDSSAPQRLQGHYYSGRGRREQGELDLQRAD